MPPSTLKLNIVANALGTASRAVMSVAFVPVYIGFVGIEAYGLVGLFAVLQAWMTLLDLGLRPALGRDTARFLGGEVGAEHVRDLLRTVEVIGACAALATALGLWLASGWLARNWVTTTTLPTESIAVSFGLMGLVVALTFIEAIYASVLAGFQRQVVLNVIGSAIAGLKSIGVIGVLAWVSPTVEAMFAWHAVVAAVSMLALAAAAYQRMPRIERRARFSVAALRSIARFAGGMLAGTLLALLLTQVDKTMLPRLVPLAEFGHYTLASLGATALSMLVMPIASAVYPRMTSLAASGEQDVLRSTYHRAAQLGTVLVAPAALMLMLFAHRILLAWTGNPHLAAEVAPLLRLVAAGMGLHCLMYMPTCLQLAHGWTGLSLRINAVAVLVYVPAILLAVPRFGAIGAAWVWLALNVVYVTIGVWLMHRRLLPGEMWTWYRADVGLPVLAAAAVALVCALVPMDFGRIGDAALLAIFGASTLAAAALAATHVRATILGLIRKRLSHVGSAQ